jgi:hypothetical protein
LVDRVRGVLVAAELDEPARDLTLQVAPHHPLEAEVTGPLEALSCEVDGVPHAAAVVERLGRVDVRPHQRVGVAVALRGEQRLAARRYRGVGAALHGDRPRGQHRRLDAALADLAGDRDRLVDRRLRVVRPPGEQQQSRVGLEHARALGRPVRRRQREGAHRHGERVCPAAGVPQQPRPQRVLPPGLLRPGELDGALRECDRELSLAGCTGGLGSALGELHVVELNGRLRRRALP